MHIRIAQENECAQIEGVFQNAFGPFRPHYNQSSYDHTVVDQTEILRRMREGVTWVAMEDGKVHGTVSIAFKKDWLYITGMAVNTTLQGKKIGYRLLVAIEDYARKNGHQQMWLGTTRFLPRAIALYKAFGFKYIEGGDFVWYGTNGIRFEKVLTSMAAAN